jgi:hypothetical protein
VPPLQGRSSSDVAHARSTALRDERASCLYAKTAASAEPRDSCQAERCASIFSPPRSSATRRRPIRLQWPCARSTTTAIRRPPVLACRMYVQRPHQAPEFRTGSIRVMSATAGTSPPSARRARLPRGTGTRIGFGPPLKACSAGGSRRSRARAESANRHAKKPGNSADSGRAGPTGRDTECCFAREAAQRSQVASPCNARRTPGS